MAKQSTDVFISCAAKDSRLAEEIADDCRRAGLEAFTGAELRQEDAATTDSLREALAESRALLTIISSAVLTPWMTISIGAAGAWGKPVFAVVTDPLMPRLPFLTSEVRYYTPGNIEDVIRAISPVRLPRAVL